MDIKKAGITGIWNERINAKLFQNILGTPKVIKKAKGKK